MSVSKPIRRLAYQFTDYLITPRLDAYQICEALKAQGLIRVTSEQAGQPTHYQETRLLKVIPADEFRSTITDVLACYSVHKLGLRTQKAE